ncbi:MAG: hypothetical protein U0903_14145 [Planctomycetales bacterium]
MSEGMTFNGFPVLADPPKADAKQTLEECATSVSARRSSPAQQGRRESISHRIGIASPVIVTGSDMRAL